MTVKPVIPNPWNSRRVARLRGRAFRSAYALVGGFPPTHWQRSHAIFGVYGRKFEGKDEEMITRALLLLAATAAYAFCGSMTFSVSMTLDDGAVVTGSFVFNPDSSGTEPIAVYDISIGMPTPGILTEPGDDGLPSSVFFPFDFTPDNSVGTFYSGGAFDFISDALFPDPLYPYHTQLEFGFVPVSPLTDSSGTLITNSSVNVNDGESRECFSCDTYVCFAGAATGGLCGGLIQAVPEPSVGLPLSFICACGFLLLFRMRRIGISRGTDKNYQTSAWRLLHWPSKKSFAEP
jgi:hypothetical protein